MEGKTCFNHLVRLFLYVPPCIKDAMVVSPLSWVRGLLADTLNFGRNFYPSAAPTVSDLQLVIGKIGYSFEVNVCLMMWCTRGLKTRS